MIHPSLIAYCIIVTVLLIAAGALVIFQYKKRPRGNTLYYQQEMNKLNSEIFDLKAENKALKKEREELENEIKNNFNTDVGHAVAGDLSGNNG